MLARISSASLVQVNGPGVVVPVIDERADGGHEFGDRGEGAAADGTG